MIFFQMFKLLVSIYITDKKSKSFKFKWYHQNFENKYQVKELVNFKTLFI